MDKAIITVLLAIVWIIVILNFIWNHQTLHLALWLLSGGIIAWITGEIDK